mmetsp:Transcript_11302/g.17147  ORF Transcript_11302/g.17147 Transcript_11302/m.17147 type:complete len:286 (-) Transcript_11302:675-1532(-)
MDIAIMRECNGLLNANFSKVFKHFGTLSPLFLVLALGFLLLLTEPEETTRFIGFNIIQIVKGNSDGKWVHIRHTNLTNTECGTHICSVESGTKGHSLIAIDVHTKVQTLTKIRLEHLLHLRDAHTTTNKFNLINICERHIGSVKSLLNGCDAALEQVVCELFKLGTAHVCTQSSVLVQTVNEDRNIVIGTEHMLDLIRLDAQLSHGTRHVTNILALHDSILIEGVSKVTNQTRIKGISSKGSIPRLTFYFEGTNSLLLFADLIFGLVTMEGDDGNLQTRAAHVVK